MNDFKSKVKEKIKMYSNKEYLKKYIEGEYLLGDKDADVYYYFNDDTELFDTRTNGVQLALNNDIYEFLEEKTDMLDNDIQIHFHIMNCNLDSKEQEMVKHMFKEHYAIELYKAQKEYVKCRNKIISLAVFGLVILLSYLILYKYDISNFLFEVLIFLFSFTLWEAGDAFIYTLSELKYNRDNVTQDLLTNVSFDE